MTTSVDITLEGDGAFFDRTVNRIVEDWTDDLLNLFASKGLSELHYQMDRYFKNPTPYYETQVTIDRAAGQRVIHDRGIVYGPWLAGTSSRNATTRFKGYPHWRRTRQYLESESMERQVKILVDRLAR